MDFLDPKKERRSRIVLLLGYCLVAVAIALATRLLWDVGQGYTVNRQGQVLQNGLLFVSSQPSGAAIKLNGQPSTATTNSRLVVPADTYNLQISESGYRPWQRQVVVYGNDVQHFDYPFLFPVNLKTTPVAELAASPSVAMQSPDKRWLLLGEAGNPGTFMQYDLKNSKKPTSTEISLPNGSYTPGDGAQTWTVVEWAADSQHVLLLHTYTSGKTTLHEYVLLDRDTPVDSVDLTNALSLGEDQTANLYDNQVSQFYVYGQTSHSLERVNASDGSVVSQLDNVLAFKTYGSDYILYVTNKPPTGKEVGGQVSVVLQAGQKTVTLRTLSADAGTYALNLAQYSGDWYVAVGDTSDTTTYVYKNPQDQVVSSVDAYPVPWRRLPLADPSFLSFSSNTQFLLAENGQDFVVYDLENIAQYRYHATEPIDLPQTHATWMDGDRLLYVSNGKLVVFDYDYQNRQTLQVADPTYAPFFAQDFSYVYALKPAAGDAGPALTSTALTVQQ